MSTIPRLCTRRHQQTLLNKASGPVEFLALSNRVPLGVEYQARDILGYEGSCCLKPERPMHARSVESLVRPILARSVESLILKLGASLGVEVPEIRAS